jgi:membrane peptidoglycan carboxypeptidase
MRRNGKLSQADYRGAVASPLRLAPPEADESENSFFISMLNDELQSTLSESAPQSRTVVTSLDAGLQRAAKAAVRSGMEAVDQQLHIMKAPAGQDSVRPQVALIALDPRTQSCAGDAAAGLGVQAVCLRRRHRHGA